MQFLYNAFLVLHFIGLAMLFGGFMVQVSSPDKGVNRTMLEGALTQLVTGIIMVGIAESKAIDGLKMNQPVVGIKLLIVLVITVLAFVYRKKQPPQVAVWAIIGTLTLVNIAVAVFAGVTAS